jgi:hypothetical protein
MSWFIHRPDNTFRPWDPRRGQEQLRAGETLRQWPAAPTMVRDDPTPAEREADALRAVEGEKILKALVIWAAQHFGLSPATARSEIIAIYKGL